MAAIGSPTWKPGRVNVHDLPTPALLVDVEAFEHNVTTMSAARPGAQLRPHVKAFKSTALAAELSRAGHQGFCAATPREILGMADAGLGEDLLLANEVIDPSALRAMASCEGRVTVAVDSAETVDAAAHNGITEVLIDVDVGCFRCGCAPEEAGRLADRARARGLEVRGVMGYEGHLMMEPNESRTDRVAEAMGLLLDAHRSVGGEVISGGGTGTWNRNHWVTELQAGSYTLMDTHYDAAGVGFAKALSLRLTVVSVNRTGGWAAADGGLKALGMDHGNASIDGASVWYHADEHTVFSMDDGAPLPAVGSPVTVWPAHVDPTVSQHEQLWVHQAGEVVACWPIDLRGW